MSQAKSLHSRIAMWHGMQQQRRRREIWLLYCMSCCIWHPRLFFCKKKKIFSTPAACHATFWCKIASFGCNADCCHNLFCMWIHQCKSKIHLICVTKKSSYGTLWPVWYQKYYWIKLEAKSMLYASIFISLTPLSYHFIFYHFIFALNQHLKQKCPLDFDHT